MCQIQSLIPRAFYLGLCCQELKETFDTYVPGNISSLDMWFEHEAKQIPWNIPFGVFFDKTFGKEAKLPIEIIVHYRIPDNVGKGKILAMKNLQSVRNAYFHTLKEASIIRFGEAQNVLSKLSVAEQQNLWKALCEESQIDFFKLFRKAWDEYKPNQKEYSVPVRIHIRDVDDCIQRALPVYDKDGNEIQIADSLAQVLPKVFEKKEDEGGKISIKYKNVLIITHGIEIPLDTTMMFISKNLLYYDGFVYITLYIAQQMMSQDMLLWFIYCLCNC
eukprot:TRINITY_DN2782_c0_g2_i5.p1 TRINITY_DN2782_c0_g2~~TRINITY_DN2782_c0_g2_i5.p1  ORF type:complete len:275 (+),score=38.61 TRINITY_DN2782_c0_g2_i5:75-899(+)